MMRNISILGSTGSIGTQTLNVVDGLKDVRVWALTTNTRIDMLEEQIRKYRPAIGVVMSERHAGELKERVKDTDTVILAGMEGLVEAATVPQVEMVITSVVGIIGLIPTLEAIKAGKHIGLANKETLVTAGPLVMKTAKEKGVKIIPVDSEHSAIFQCLEGNKAPRFIKKLILTASGGPFLGKKLEELREITPQQALKHPKWNMGSKISIDSATLMNKGLEVIEARWLFDIGFDNIEVVVHPQSIIHSMVEFVDGSILAQMGVPDMRIPIQYAITYPDRSTSSSESLDFMKHNTLTFSQPDMETFRCLKLAYEAGRVGGTMPVVLNAANEVAVQLFLDGKIGFLQIAESIERVMKQHTVMESYNLEHILESDKWARDTLLTEIA